MRKLIWLLLILPVLSCAGMTDTTAVFPTIESVAESSESNPETAAEVELRPTSTIAPPTPSSIPPTLVQPALTATAVPTPSPPPTIGLDAPGLVWLPYATGNFGQPVVMVEDEAITLQPLPFEVEIFFDFEAGWLAYGSKFWDATANQRSVTNLHLYEFSSGTDRLWAEGNIGRAEISPVGNFTGQPTVAVAVYNGEDFDLMLQAEPGSNVLLVEDIDPYFSWSPDGTQIAYLRDNELFITGTTADAGNPPIASGVYENSGWIGDAPLWLGDSGYLLYADAPFTIVAGDGSQTIIPQDESGAPLEGARPFAMRYSAVHNQLIAESEGMFGTNVAVYQLSEGFETAVLTEQIDDAQLAGWYQESESVIIVQGGAPTILALTPQN